MYFLQTLEIFFYVIILTEIGARNLGLVEHLLPTHTFYHVTPDDNNWGGVGIYVSNEATDVIVRPEYELKKSCNRSKCEFESLLIALKLRSHRLTTGGIYRHPSGNIKHFISDLENSLEQIKDDHTSIIAGDLNIDIIQFHVEDVLKYITTLMSAKYLPYIVQVYSKHAVDKLE